jgi:hypothetical protein
MPRKKTCLPRFLDVPRYRHTGGLDDLLGGADYLGANAIAGDHGNQFPSFFVLAESHGVLLVSLQGQPI